MIFANIQNLVISPKKYFEENLQSREFSINQFLVTALFLVLAITIVSSIEREILEKYSDILASLIYFSGFFVGLMIKILFRAYFLRLMLSKLEVNIDYSKIAMIITVAMFTYLLMYLIPILINTNVYNMQIFVVMKIWNLFLITVGIKVISKLSYFRSFILVLLMIGFEYILTMPFYGIVL